VQQQQQQQSRRLHAAEPMAHRTKAHSSSSSGRVRRPPGTTSLSTTTAGADQQARELPAAAVAAAAAATRPAAAQVTASPPALVRVSSVQVVSGVTSHTWEPQITVEPGSLTVPQGAGPASLRYTVQVLRNAQQPMVLLSGQLQVGNAGSRVLRLVQVAVEVPAAGREAWAYVDATCPSPAAVAAAATGSSTANSGSSGSLVGLVPPRSQLPCTFELLYPAAAPPTGTLIARVVTEAGEELPSKPQAFNTQNPGPRQQPPAGSSSSSSGMALGACAVVTNTFISPDDTHGVLQPAQQVANAGFRVPAAASSSSSSGVGVVLCDSTTWSYSVDVGPFEAGQCGPYKVRGTTCCCWWGRHDQHSCSLHDVLRLLEVTGPVCCIPSASRLVATVGRCSSGLLYCFDSQCVGHAQHPSST
jgi:hypothetical protein